MKTPALKPLFNKVAGLNLTQDGPFRGCSRTEEGQQAPQPPPPFCCTYPAITKLGTVRLYLKKIQKIYESRDTPLEFP